MLRRSLTSCCAPMLLRPSRPLLQSISGLVRCGADCEPLSSQEVAATYGRPSAVPAPRLVSTRLDVEAANNGIEVAAVATSSEAMQLATSGPVCDLSIVGVVKNVGVGPEDEEPQQQIRCEVVTNWISPARGLVSDLVADKQVLRVSVRASKDVHPAWMTASKETTPFRDGAVVFLLGKLYLKPMFDATSFTYQYTPELVLSDEFGEAECVLYERAVLPPTKAAAEPK